MLEKIGGVTLMLGIPEAPQFDHPSSIIYFDVEDFVPAYSSLTQLGVGFHRRPHLIAAMEQYDLWMTFFRDSEDNILALMSRKKKVMSDS